MCGWRMMITRRSGHAGGGVLDNAKARLAELKAGSRPEEIAQAKAQWDRAVIDYQTADRSWKRLLNLKNSQSVTQNELEDAEALAQSRQVQAESQRQEYELMKVGARQEQIDAQEATVRQLERAAGDGQDHDLNAAMIRASRSPAQFWSTSWKWGICHQWFCRRPRGEGICRVDGRSERSAGRYGHQPE